MRLLKICSISQKRPSPIKNSTTMLTTPIAMILPKAQPEVAEAEEVVETFTTIITEVEPINDNIPKFEIN
jgi:hypothetical protein